MRINLRKTLFLLPNLFTLSSIFCGSYATLLCTSHPGSDEDVYRAALLIMYAMLFDTLDGRVARMTRTQSAFGVQIDSLGDIVSFGIAPAVVVHRWSLATLGPLGSFAAFAFVACGAIRLARFNVLSTDTRGTPRKPGKYILGLPIPAAAGILISLVVANHAVAGYVPGSPLVILAIVLLLSAFMVSTVRFRSFKELQLSWRTATLVVLVISASTVVAVRLHIAYALVCLSACYLVIGVFETITGASRRSAESVPPPPP